MRKLLLFLFLSVVGVAAQSAAVTDMINLQQFVGSTPGSTCWFTTPRTFNTEATYAGYISVAKDGSGMSFGKNTDYFYVENPVPDARIKQINVQFLTEGELRFYMSDTRKRMSGGSYQVISNTEPIINFDGDQGYFVVRCGSKDCIVSSITITWESTSEVTVDTPVMLVDGEPFDATTELDLGGAPKQVTFVHSDIEASIYYMWEPDVATGMPLFDPYTGPLTFRTTGSLSYYAELDGVESELTVVRIVGEEVVRPVAPEARVDGVALSHDEPFDIYGEPRTVSLSHPDADVAIYHLWQPVEDVNLQADGASGDAVFTEYTPGGFVLETPGRYSFYAEKYGEQSDTVTIEVVDTYTFAIDGIESDVMCAPAQWFDLNGRQVSMPVSGICIRRTSGKSEKVKL